MAVGRYWRCALALFFNYGLADQAAKRPVTSDSLFNVGSVRKIFEATLVAQGVLRGEIRLDDPVARYVTERPHVDLSPRKHSPTVYGGGFFLARRER